VNPRERQQRCSQAYRWGKEIKGETRGKGGKKKGLTGIPLEQLIPAPLTTTTRLALAILLEISANAVLPGKSACEVDESK
jgi:hypothetical protein